MQKIESKDNPYIKHLCKLRDDTGYMREKQLVLLEGEDLINELAPFVKQGKLLANQPVKTDWPQVEISGAVAAKLSLHKDEGAVFAELPLPELKFPQKFERLLILDGVADPGNVGTLLRSSLALGWEGVLLLPGCADPFNTKALRASKGAPFKFPCLKGTWQDVDRIAAAMTVLVADLAGEKPETFQGKKCALILGNEGQGVSKEALERGRAITIPMQGPMESLNVAAAGAILMYTLRGP